MPNMKTRRFWSPFLHDDFGRYYFSGEIPGNVSPLKFLRRYFACYFACSVNLVPLTFYRLSLDGKRIYKYSGHIETLIYVA